MLKRRTPALSLAGGIVASTLAAVGVGVASTIRDTTPPALSGITSSGYPYELTAHRPGIYGRERCWAELSVSRDPAGAGSTTRLCGRLSADSLFALSLAVECGSEPDVIAVGEVASSVARLDVVLTDGRHLTPDVLRLSAYGAPHNYFAVPISVRSVERVIAYGEHGEVLQARQYPAVADPCLGMSGGSVFITLG